MTAQNGIFTIPPSAAFLPNVAAEILREAKATNTELTSYHVYLPTRRACRALADAFLELTNGVPLLLPHILPIGDVDEDTLGFHITAFGENLDLPKALHPLRRQMLLAQLVHKIYPERSFVQALSLSQQLGFLLDQVNTEELSFDSLKDLVPENFAQHWGITLDFLALLSTHWPLILKAENALDASTRRVKLLRAQADLWEKSPPLHPIIFAGSTGSIPATRALMKVVKNLPYGRVILPGLDPYLSHDAWEKIPETHPQYTMKSFLDFCEVARASVLPWPLQFSPPADSEERFKLTSSSLAPARSDAIHSEPQPLNKNCLENIFLITAKTPRDEAMMIALSMREVLESRDVTACLITPNRLIGQRVATLLKRWGIDIDDTAGKTCRDTQSYDYLLRLLAVSRDAFSPLSLLEFLHHPLNRDVFDQTLLYDFEKTILRRPQHKDGLRGLLSLCADTPAYIPLVDNLQTRFAAFSKTDEKQSLRSWINQLVACAQNFIDEKILWETEGGDSVLQILADLHDEAYSIEALSCDEAYAILQYLAMQTPVRTAHLTHPRLTILGQLESRLMQADVMILAGLNEGVWPEDAGVNPFLSRPMRKDFGLPGLERSLGLSAHDFVAGFCGKRVILARSEQEEGAPTTPSRWLQRLQTEIQKTFSVANFPPSSMLALAEILDHPTQKLPPAHQPNPVPNLDDRPHHLSVTRVQTLQENPYRFYGEKILRLKTLDDVDDSKNAALWGTVLHAVMERFIDHIRDHIPTNAETVFLELCEELLETYGFSDVEKSYLKPSLTRLASHIVALETQWQKHARVHALERSGKTIIETDKGAITLTAKADRIDVTQGNRAIIMDYKSGQVPEKTKIKYGLAPQLPLEAIILSDHVNGFGTDLTPHTLRYLRLSSRKNPVEIFEFDEDIAQELITLSKKGIHDLVDVYLDPKTSFPAIMITDHSQQRSDIRWWNHLARASEWAIENDQADEGAA